MRANDAQLLPGEEVRYEGKLHPYIFVKGLLIAGLGFAFMHTKGASGFDHFLFGSAAFILVLNLIAFTKSRFVVTNKRLIMNAGWLKPESHDFLYDQIESVSIEQGIVGNVANFGQVVVRGAGTTPVGFTCVSAPKEFRRQFQIVNTQRA